VAPKSASTPIFGIAAAFHLERSETPYLDGRWDATVVKPAAIDDPERTPSPTARRDAVFASPSMKEFVMLRIVKSIVLCGAVAAGSLFAAAPQAEAGGWSISYNSGFPGYGSMPYAVGYPGYGYGGGQGYGGCGHRGGYGAYNLYNNGFGYQSFYTPGSNFRGAPAFSAYPHLNCR
jgi:hypothetical protein